MTGNSNAISSSSNIDITVIPCTPNQPTINDITTPIAISITASFSVVTFSQPTYDSGCGTIEYHLMSSDGIT